MLRGGPCAGFFVDEKSRALRLLSLISAQWKYIGQEMRGPVSLLLSILLLPNCLLISHAASSLDVLGGPGIKQLRECALLGLETSIDDKCPTDGCICQSGGLPLILHAVSTAVDDQCSNNIYDATAAMAAVISYCGVHGYTIPSDLAPITAPPPGA